MSETTVNRNYKDTLFRMVFQEKKELLNTCKKLHDYSYFVSKVREYLRQGLVLSEAVDRAVLHCIEKDVLKELLEIHRTEVKQVILEEYDEELHMKTLYEEGLAEGEAKGKAAGLAEGRAAGLAEAGLEGSVVGKADGADLQIRHIPIISFRPTAFWQQVNGRPKKILLTPSGAVPSGRTVLCAPSVPDSFPPLRFSHFPAK